MPRRHPSLSWLAAAVLALPALAGCRIMDRGESDGTGGGPADELTSAEQELVDDSADAEEGVRADSGLAALPTFAFIGRQDRLTLARAVQLQTFAPRAFLPAGCATVETAGNVVTYAFDGCTGPLGLVEVSGREVVTFRPGAEVGSIEMTMASEGLTLQGRPVQHDATVSFGITEAGRVVRYVGSFSGTTVRGLPIEHTSDLRLVTDAGSECATLDGVTRGTIGARGLDTTFEAFSRCAPTASCPSGNVTSTGRLSGLSVEVAFDGTDVALVTTPRGREVEIDLACTPREVP